MGKGVAALWGRTCVFIDGGRVNHGSDPDSQAWGRRRIPRKSNAVPSIKEAGAAGKRAPCVELPP